uniref:Uncharacterized protein n=1 Tax=Leersia perrieri TaxID=77586 RepID=A0A0D9XZ43_9ORYZ
MGLRRGAGRRVPPATSAAIAATANEAKNVAVAGRRAPFQAPATGRISSAAGDRRRGRPRQSYASPPADGSAVGAPWAEVSGEDASEEAARLLSSATLLPPQLPGARHPHAR